MPIRFFCPRCEAKLTVSRRYGGRKGRCPNCKTKVRVPEVKVADADLSAVDSGAQTDSGATPIKTVTSDTVTSDNAEGSTKNKTLAGGDSVQKESGESRRSKNAWDRTRELNENVEIPRWIV